MNTKTTYFGLIAALAILSTIRICNASTGADLYNDSLYLQKSSGEVPKAFESSARENLAANDTVEIAPTAAESIADVEEVVASSKKTKRAHSKLAKRAVSQSSDTTAE